MMNSKLLETCKFSAVGKSIRSAFDFFHTILFKMA
jgi:hypothetical protein